MPNLVGFFFVCWCLFLCVCVCGFCFLFLFFINYSGFVFVVAVRGNDKVSIDVCVLSVVCVSLFSVSLVFLPFCIYIVDVFLYFLLWLCIAVSCLFLFCSLLLLQVLMTITYYQGRSSFRKLRFSVNFYPMFKLNIVRLFQHHIIWLYFLHH